MIHSTEDSTSDLFSRMKQRAEQPTQAPRWAPEPGDVLMGLLVKVTEVSGRDGSSFPVILLALEDGSSISVACSKVLTERLQETRPRIGDGLVITYEGEARSKRGYSYKRFLMDHIPAIEPATTDDWEIDNV